MTFKYELHMHTAESSKCGVSPAREMIRELKRQGFTGVVVTDHFVNANARVNRKAPWPVQIDQILAGYRQALAAGEQYDVQVFLGWEYHADWNDYVTFGLPEPFLYEHPELRSLAPQAYADLVHARGGFIIHAHPYREAEYIPQHKTGNLYPGVHDAIEVYNAGNQQPEFNERAYAYAREHQLPMTAGSDTHSVDTIGSSYMAFPRRLEDEQDLIKAIRSQEGQMMIRSSQSEQENPL